MEKGSKFTAALLAVLAFQMLQPHGQVTPFWQDLVAALAGTLTAWAMAVFGDRLKAWRSGRRLAG
jgi:hypothetical protein